MKKEKGMKERGFVGGAVILGVSAIFVRLVGFFFRIYLSNAMGAQGMGVYSLIMSVYALTCTLATSGIATAVSRLVAEQMSLRNEANAKRVLRRAVSLSLILGCIVGVILFLSASFIGGQVMSDERTILSLRILAPGLPFLSMSSCFRGYFIARRRVGNPASAQVVEQLFKMAFIILLLGQAIPMGIEYACAVVVMGMTAGEAVCFICTYAGYIMQKRRDNNRKKADANGVTRQIIEIILPISVTACIRSALRLFEDILVMRGFKIFSGDSDIATGTYGMLKGMAMPLLLFPLSLMSSFVITLTPEISRLRAREEYMRLEFTIGRILQYTCCGGLLIVCVFMTFSRELGMLVYKEQGVGELLCQLSFLCPFMCLESVTVSILQGLGEQKASAAYNLMDCGLRVALIRALIPLSGTVGFMWMIAASNLFTSVLNLHRLLRILPIRFRFNEWVVRPGIAAAASSQVIKTVYQYHFLQSMDARFSLILGIVIVCAAYTLLLLFLGCVNTSDIEWVTNKLWPGAKQPKMDKEIAC